jgi:DNA adenine methylase
VISYVGGKFKMAKWISSFIPKTNKYVELFGGAYWTYLNSDLYKKIDNAYYNDFSIHMANLMSCYVYNQKFFDHFKHIKSQDENLFNQYKQEILNVKEIDVPDFDLAFKYAYLMTQVFSGTGLKENTKMTNLKGKYKSKFDSFRERMIKPSIIEKTKKIKEVYNKDFEEVINILDSEYTVFYIDPPYYNTENYYSFHDFTRKDHERVADCLKNINGKFLLSYYYFNDLEKWFPKDKYVWESKEFAKAAGAKKNVKNNKGTELLIMNYGQ